MLFDDDPLVGELSGMKHTFHVSSCFFSSSMKIQHVRMFNSFPSLAFPVSFPSCFPLSKLKQLLSIKQKVQVALNTRSLSSNNRASCFINNIDPLTWRYLMQGTWAVVEQSREILKATYMDEYECVVKNWHSVVESCMISLPEHLAFAQGIFGKTVGIDVQLIVLCSVEKKQNRVDCQQQITKDDTIKILFHLECNP